MRLRLSGALDLEATLHSGQAFRWQTTPLGEIGFVDNRPVRVRLAGRTLEATGPGADAAALRRYFRLDSSHDEFLATAPDEPFLVEAIAAFPGLRLLRQDAWEMLVSFVVSQNSNEARIRQNVEALCRAAGRRVRLESGTVHAFPSARDLAQLGQDALRRLGLGYRAAYVAAVSDLVSQGAFDPDALADMSYEEARQALTELPGVGPKVADCVLLYGCDHLNAFPADVWVRRILRERYYRGPTKQPSDAWIRWFAARRFGPNAGYAQHYLFHYRRRGAVRPLEFAARAI